MAFGAEIKRLREDAAISAQKLADKIGINADRLRKWEKLDGTPRDQDTLKIERFFGMAIAEVQKLKSIKKFLIIPNENDAIEKRDDLAAIIGSLEERLLRVEVKLDTLGKTVVDIQSKVTGVSAAKLSLELERTTMDFLKLRLDELRNE